MLFKGYGFDYLNLKVSKFDYSVKYVVLFKFKNHLIVFRLGYNKEK